MEEYITQEEARRTAFRARRTSIALSALRLNRSNQQIEHRVPDLPVIRAEGELVEVVMHILRRDMSVRRSDRGLEVPPEVLNRIGRVRHAMPVIRMPPIRSWNA